MKKILDDIGLDYEIGIDEAAFYGPKLDVQYKNVFGKEDTIVTIQIDMLLAEKFGMYYVDKDGQKKLPYIIHRTSLGCYERTLAYMLEHFNGVLPLWLAPEQVRILPIKAEHVEYAQKIDDRLTYMFIIGDNEVNSGTVTVRSRKEGEMPSIDVDSIVSKLDEEIRTKAK